MQIIVCSKLTTPTEFRVGLEETGTGMNQFSNYQITVGPGVYSNPATDGQGVFYIQASGTASTQVIVRSGSNQIMVSATPVAGRPHLLRTGKLVLIAPHDPFRAPNITTLTFDPTAADGNVKAQIAPNANMGIKR
jgi:hypothetical protein